MTQFWIHNKTKIYAKYILKYLPLLWKTDKIWKFLNKKGQFKNFIKNLTEKLKPRHNMQPKTLTRREYKGNIYVKNSVPDPRHFGVDPDPGIHASN